MSFEPFIIPLTEELVDDSEPFHQYLMAVADGRDLPSAYRDALTVLWGRINEYTSAACGSKNDSPGFRNAASRGEFTVSCDGGKGFVAFNLDRYQIRVSRFFDAKSAS